MAQRASAINNQQTDPAKQILLDPEHKQVKAYLIPYAKLSAFLDFCRQGLVDDNGRLRIVDGKPADGVLAWLRRKGVKRADFWILEPPEEGEYKRRSGSAEGEESVLFIAAIDKYGLKGPDWYSIAGIYDFLDPEYPILEAKKLENLRICEPEAGGGFIRNFFHGFWERLREIFNRAARVL